MAQTKGKAENYPTSGIQSSLHTGILLHNDAEAQMILPLQELDMEAAEAALARVDAGGGTAIYPGLRLGYEMIRQSDSEARHIVVMTDGLSQPGDYEGVLSEMAAEGITASAVAIGQGADHRTVTLIAELGGGSAHITRDFEALPSILSQEAMLFSEPVEEGTTQPEWRDVGAPFLRGLPNPMPPLEGFVLTTAKPEAHLAMTTPDSEGEDAPVLAWWQYGNGNVLAFSSDATGAWTEHWHWVEQYPTLWTQTLREFLPDVSPPGYHLTVAGDAETLQLSLVALDREGAPMSGLALAAEATGPAGDTTTVELREERPGIYRTQVSLGAPGSYDVHVEIPDVGAEVQAKYYHSYSAQFNFGDPNGAAEWLVDRAGGQTRSAEEVIAITAALGVNWKGGWIFWSLVSVILFMIELLRRYGAFPGRRTRRSTEGRNA